MDTAEERFRFAVTMLLVDSSREALLADTARCIRGIQGVEEGSFAIKAFYPENFILACNNGATRDRILAASPLPFAGTSFTMLSWTRVAHAEATVIEFKVGIELEGIPPHAWAEDTAAKILALSCWLHDVDQATANKSDLFAYKLTAWTSDPRAIPRVVWLYIVEHEVVHVSTNPGFGNLPPFIWRKKVLGYLVLVHLKHVTDFEPKNPTLPPSPSDSDDCEDSNRDRHHFTQGGAVHRIQGFPTARGVVDGDPLPNNYRGAVRRRECLTISQAGGAEP